MIPKILHRIWVGDPMPRHYEEFAHEWRRLHPGWQFKLWTEKDLEGWLRNQQLFDNAEKITLPDAVGQYRSDVARYEILHRFGGVYVDCDVQPLKPIDDLLLGVQAFAGWEQDEVFVGNTVLGSVPGTRIMDEMIKVLPGRAKQNKGRAATHLSGPRVLTGIHHDLKRESDLTTYPQAYFFPYSYKDLKGRGDSSDPSTGQFTDAYAVHHWGHMREKFNKPMNVVIPAKKGTLSIAIMAHQLRKEWVAELELALDGRATVVWDRINDRHETGLRAMRAFDPDASHHLIIQDDALVSQDLLSGVENLLGYVPSLSPVSLYTGRVRPRHEEFSQLVHRAEQEKACFITHKGPWWGVGVVLPTAIIPEMSAWYESRNDIPNYDRRMSRWFESKGIPCYYTFPSLVDHREIHTSGDKNPSLVRGRGSDGRRAFKSIGPRSALEVDWSGPVIGAYTR